MSKTLLSFELGGVGYGIPLDSIREVCLPLATIAIPKGSPVIKGLMNLRGELVLLLDLGWWLTGVSQKVTDSSRILLLNPNVIEASGILIDGLGEVREVHQSDLSSVVGTREEKTQTEAARAMISGVCNWGDRVISVIDPTKMGGELTKIISEHQVKSPKAR